MSVSTPIHTARITSIADLKAFQLEAAIRIGNLHLTNQAEQYENLIKYASVLEKQINRGEVVEAAFIVLAEPQERLAEKVSIVNTVLADYGLTPISASDIRRAYEEIRRVKTPKDNVLPPRAEEISPYTPKSWVEYFVNSGAGDKFYAEDSLISAILEALGHLRNMGDIIQDYKSRNAGKSAQDSIDFFRPQIEEAANAVRHATFKDISHFPPAARKAIAEFINKRIQDILKAPALKAQLDVFLKDYMSGAISGDKSTAGTDEREETEEIEEAPGSVEERAAKEQLEAPEYGLEDEEN